MSGFLFYMQKRANCFARVRDEKGAAMFLFERALAAKGKNREPGLQAFYVSKMTGRRGPFTLAGKLLCPREKNIIQQGEVLYPSRTKAPCFIF